MGFFWFLGIPFLSAEGQSPPQELEVGPHSGPYLLVSFISVRSRDSKFASMCALVTPCQALAKSSRYPFLIFSGPRFWILTMGVKGQPVWGLPCPNYILMLGMKQPTVPVSFLFVIVAWMFPVSLIMKALNDTFCPPVQNCPWSHPEYRVLSPISEDDWNIKQLPASYVSYNRNIWLSIINISYFESI